jgi:hypothetical protein
VPPPHELKRAHDEARRPVAPRASSFSSTWPAALTCTRSPDSTGLVMSWRSCYSRLQSCPLDPHGSVQAEPVDFGARGLACWGIAPLGVSTFCTGQGPEAMRYATAPPTAAACAPHLHRYPQTDACGAPPEEGLDRAHVEGGDPGEVAG